MKHLKILAMLLFVAAIATPVIFNRTVNSQDSFACARTGLVATQCVVGPW